MAVSNLRRRVFGNTVSRTVFSAWAWFVLGIIVIIWVPLVAIVWVVTVPFDKGRYWPGWLFRKLCVVHNWFNPLWKFRTSGTMIHDPRRPYVVVSNHESFVDMLLISHLPWEMKWLSKQHFFRFPLVGWMMRMAGDIRLNVPRFEAAHHAVNRGLLPGWAALAAEADTFGTVPAAAVCRAALAGDPGAQRLIAQMADWLGMAVASWRASFHPDLIVFGGGLSVLGQPFIDQIRARADARSLPFLSAHCRLTLARLGNDAGMIGAGLAALAP